MDQIHTEEAEGTVVFRVKIVPGSSKTTMAGILDGMLKIKVTAPPEKGKANQCLIDFLSEKLEVKKRDVAIISGSTNQIKTLKVAGATAEQLQNLINS